MGTNFVTRTACIDINNGGHAIDFVAKNQLFIMNIRIMKSCHQHHIKNDRLTCVCRRNEQVYLVKERCWTIDITYKGGLKDLRFQILINALIIVLN